MSQQAELIRKGSCWGDLFKFCFVCVRASVVTSVCYCCGSGGAGQDRCYHVDRMLFAESLSFEPLMISKKVLQLHLPVSFLHLLQKLPVVSLSMPQMSSSF